MIPTHNLTAYVEEFLSAAAVPTDGSSPKAIALYLGLLIEEGFVELMQSIGLEHMPCVGAANHMADMLKGNIKRDLILGANREKMLDMALDTAWVALALAKTLGADLDGAIGELGRSNLIDKVFPDGKLHRDSNGKVVKPKTWTPPDFARFLPASVPVMDLA